jgi:hypothetical protein
VARAPGHPHPRPVWGISHRQLLYLIVGSPTLLRAVVQDPAVTVHLDSGTDVVLVEGMTSPTAQRAAPPSVVEAYNAKYDWDYQVAQDGELTVMARLCKLSLSTSQSSSQADIDDPPKRDRDQRGVERRAWPMSVADRRRGPGRQLARRPASARSTGVEADKSDRQ